ncbi:hypothetical protein ACFU6I_38925 [Streptomyces sp. NPDC057486]|uniref:hypothetical protein n=1 Tax=Streptomyces sp. NPDC057486 TaxID=3346145 RepID=UPI0036C96E99
MALSSLLGTVIEYDDFLLYGTMAAIAFGRLFFPGSDPTAGSLLSASGGVSSTPLVAVAVLCGPVTAPAIWRTAETRARNLADDSVPRRRPESSREHHDRPDGAAQNGAGK